MTDFDNFFRVAAGQTDCEGPFPYQRRLALDREWPALIEVPTGLGKTLAVVVAWLWRRQEDRTVREATPRRLVYCLPMRVLVEQTRDVVTNVLKRLKMDVRVVVLMGGVGDDVGWDIRPEDDAIIIGTQDMLLSRALNRGYGMSRYRWPLHFGILNNDCQWIVDEVQLVGSGIATAAQLQALRRKLGTVLPTHTSWMSATLEESWLRTVDVEDADLRGRLRLDVADREHSVVARRLGAPKRAHRAGSNMGELKGLANEIIRVHAGRTRTLVIMNTVERARELFKLLRRGRGDASCVLLHSRFRPQDRQRALDAALAEPPLGGTVVVSTQVIEAGVDLSSATLFTEMAPWSSLVQRFGRCNRRGEEVNARVFWISLPASEKERVKVEKPYRMIELLDAERALGELSEVGPDALPLLPLTMGMSPVLRRRDLLDLFDTTPDLMGNDVDVSRFIRDADELNVQLCWREFEDEPDRDAPSPERDELCAAPLGVIREWLKRKKRVWAYDGLARAWRAVEDGQVHPGLVLQLRCIDGGYDPYLGLDPVGTTPVAQVRSVAAGNTEDRDYEGDPESEWGQWYTLKQHSGDVAVEANALAEHLRLPAGLAAALTTAARWHDAGKAHKVWQSAARSLGDDPPKELIAKSRALRRSIRFQRRGFRHELASALLALQHGQSDLVAFLVASHHGKVRMSLRALPKEPAPKLDGHENRSVRYARGVWDGDVLPEIDLGGGVVVPETRLTLQYMDLGHDDVTGSSWLSRMVSLRDDRELGPFRLGFLEALIKSADERASALAFSEEATP